jgi:hypothetical protein
MDSEYKKAFSLFSSGGSVARSAGAISGHWFEDLKDTSELPTSHSDRRLAADYRFEC